MRRKLVRTINEHNNDFIRYLIQVIESKALSEEEKFKAFNEFNKVGFKEFEIDYKRPSDSRTLLAIASSSGSSGAVKSLLENGSDIKIRDNNNCTPLMIALQSGHADVADLIINKTLELDPQNQTIKDLKSFRKDCFKIFTKIYQDEGAEDYEHRARKEADSLFMTSAETETFSTTSRQLYRFKNTEYNEAVSSSTPISRVKSKLYNALESYQKEDVKRLCQERVVDIFQQLLTPDTQPSEAIAVVEKSTRVK
jgi:ankyrin repeat protein